MRAPKDARIVVIRHRSKYAGTSIKLAWLLRNDPTGKVIVRLRVGTGGLGGYLPRAASIDPDQVIRDATPRERDLGEPAAELRAA